MIRLNSRTILIGALLMGVAGYTHAQEIDEALRERDLSRVLSLLQPERSEPAEAPPSLPPAETPVPVRPTPPVRLAPPATVPAEVEIPEEPAPKVAQPAERPAQVPASRMPHRVTVVSSDGSVREAQPAPSVVLPPVAAPPPAASAPAPQPGQPAQVGAPPSVARVPKVAPSRTGQTAPPPRMPRPAPASVDLPEGEADLDIAAETLLPEEEARTRAAGLLTELTRREPPSSEEPAGLEGEDAPDDPEAADDADAPAEPLGLLDQLAQRLGASAQPPESTAPDPSVDAAVDPGVEATPAVALSAQMDERMDQIRVELDRLLHVTRADIGLSAAQDVAAAAPVGGWRYSGQWRSGKMDGVGTLSYSDGWSFTGDWREGRISGKGALRYPDGSMYDGDWVDGKMDGFGIFTFPDGWRYIGQWRAGRMHGTGELIHPEAHAPTER